MSTPDRSPRGAIVALGAVLIGLLTLFAHGQLWVAAASLLIGAWTLLLAWLAGRARAGAPAGVGPTFAIWGRWEGRGWAWLRGGLRGELARAGYQPASRRGIPDILICGPGAPRLAGWTPRRVAGRVVGVLPGRTLPEPARWVASLLQRRSWDAVVYLGLDPAHPTATLVDARGAEVRLAGPPDRASFLHALARLVIAPGRGGDAGAAGF